MFMIEAFAVILLLWVITAETLCVLGHILASIVDEAKNLGHSPTLDRLAKRK